MCFGGGVWVCVEFAVAGWSKMKMKMLRLKKFEVGASNEKSCLWWSVNLTCVDFSCTKEGLRLRKLLTDDWVHLSPRLVFRGVEEGGGTAIACTFLMGLCLGSSNVEKWGKHQRKKLFINNSVEALILFKEEHQGLLKLHVLLRWEWGFRVWGKKWGYLQKREFSLKPKNNLWGGFLECIEILFMFWRVFGVLMKKKWGGNRKKRFYSEMQGNNVWGGLVKVLWDSPCVTILWELSLSKGGSLLRGEVGWDRVASGCKGVTDYCYHWVVLMYA